MPVTEWPEPGPDHRHGTRITQGIMMDSQSLWHGLAAAGRRGGPGPDITATVTVCHGGRASIRVRRAGPERTVSPSPQRVSPLDPHRARHASPSPPRQLHACSSD
jgi:hypothetical protein